MSKSFLSYEIIKIEKSNNVSVSMTNLGYWLIYLFSAILF